MRFGLNALFEFEEKGMGDDLHDTALVSGFTYKYAISNLASAYSLKVAISFNAY